MLSEIISGSIGLANVVSPIRRLCPPQLKIHYDYLAIALGNVMDFDGMSPAKPSCVSCPPRCRPSLKDSSAPQARTAINVLIIPKGDFDELRHSVPAFGEFFRALAKQRSQQPPSTSDSAGT